MSSNILTHGLYRYSHPDGSSKDWAIGQSAGDINIYFGKTGSKLRKVVVPPQKLKKATVDEEIQSRIDDQIKQGYQLVGDVVIEDNRVVETPDDNLHRTLEWDMSKPVPVERMLEVLHDVATALGKAPWPGVKVSFENESLCAKTPAGSWIIGFQDTENGGISRDTGKGGGIIRASHGPIPVLVMMALERTFPDTFVFGDGTTETAELSFDINSPWLAPAAASFDRLQKLAVKLGICAPSLSDCNVQATGIWF